MKKYIVSVKKAELQHTFLPAAKPRLMLLPWSPTIQCFHGVMVQVLAGLGQGPIPEVSAQWVWSHERGDVSARKVDNVAIGVGAEGVQD